MVDHNRKVSELKQRESSEEKRQTALATKVANAEERRLQLVQMKLDRVANHNRKVAEIKRNLSAEKLDSRKSLCLQLESRQQSAQQKREELIKQVREKQATVGIKKSPQQSESTKAM